MTLPLLAQLFGLQEVYQDAAICLSKCLVTFHHASWFEEHPFFTPLAVQQLPQFLSRLICLGGPSENSHHHEDKVFKSHGQQHLNPFVAACGCPASTCITHIKTLCKLSNKIHFVFGVHLRKCPPGHRCQYHTCSEFPVILGSDDLTAVMSNRHI